MQKVISFIGAGNMATSMIGGLIADGYDPKKIWASNPEQEQLQRLHKNFGIHATTDNHEAVSKADVVIFSVKPQILKTVVKELATEIHKKRPLIISIAAMIPSGHIEKWLGEKLAIVRCMPNTPALIQSGASGLYANSHVSEEQKSLAESILRAVGVTVWIENEDLMNAVTALSGNGPAYYFYFMENLQKAGEKMGLSKETAKLLTLQTALGAARLALETKEDLQTLRRQVTSPGGMTERALEILQEANFEKWLYDAMTAAEQRALELAEKLKD